MPTHDIDVLIVGEMYHLLTENVERDFRTHKLWLTKDRDAFLREHGPLIRGVVTSGNPVFGASRGLIEALPKLEIIASFGVGYDPIDIVAAKERGVIVTNTPKVLDDCVADLGFALILAVSRRICVADRYVREGNWISKGRFPIASKVSRKVCGIVGLGNIGRQVAQRAQGFGMPVHFYDPVAGAEGNSAYIRHDSLESLAAAANYLVLTLPGGKATRRVINADVLAALGKKGYLINICRGSVVDENALVAALRDGVIAGAGLDVYESEPTVPAELMQMENVVILPHIASSTLETRIAMCDLTFANLKAHFEGKPVLTRVV